MLTGIKIIRKTDKKEAEEEPLLESKKWKTNSSEAQMNSKDEDQIQCQMDVNDEILLKDIHKQKLKEKVIPHNKKQYQMAKTGESDEEKTGEMSKAQFIKEQKKEQNKQKKQKAEQRKTVNILENCQYCLENCMIGEKYILSNANHSMLLLPNYQCYAGFYHFYIIPIDHVPSVKDADEEAWEEIRNYMKCLVSAFDAVDMEVLFFENAYNFKQMPHCKLEVVAIPYAITKEANLDLYFRQGMEDLDGYWSVHKKIINLTKEQGGIRKQIPKGFPYFYVDFGTKNGMAHVIENEKYFGENFVQEILATVLKIDKNRVLYPKEYSKEDCAKVFERFKKLWAKHDWTLLIHEEKEEEANKKQ